MAEKALYDPLLPRAGGCLHDQENMGGAESIWLAGAGQGDGGNQPEAGVGGTKYYSTKQSSIQEGGNQSMSYFQ